MSTCLNAPVGILNVQIVGLLVEDRRRRVLVFVGPAPNPDHAFHERYDKLRMLLGHYIGAGNDGGDIGNLQPPVRIPGQVLNGSKFTRRFLYMLEDSALCVDRIDLSFKQRSFQRTKGQVVFVVTVQLPMCRIDQGYQHLGIVVPVVRVREIDELDIFFRHAVHS